MIPPVAPQPKRKWPKLKAHHPYVVAVVSFAFAVLFLYYTFSVTIETYKQIRGSLFTGFFTVAGFLLSAKTLVILNMKREVYEKSHYLQIIHEEHWSRIEHGKKQGNALRAECGPSPSVYRPLSQIGTLLTINIILSLLTSFAQITLGLTDSCFAVAFCLSLALSTGFLLACSVCLMWQNFHALYKVWEDQAQQELEKHWATAMSKFKESAPVPVPGVLPTQPSTSVGGNDRGTA